MSVSLSQSKKGPDKNFKLKAIYALVKYTRYISIYFYLSIYVFEYLIFKKIVRFLYVHKDLGNNWVLHCRVASHMSQEGFVLIHSYKLVRGWLYSALSFPFEYKALDTRGAGPHTVLSGYTRYLSTLTLKSISTFRKLSFSVIR